MLLPRRFPRIDAHRCQARHHFWDYLGDRLSIPDQPIVPFCQTLSAVDGTPLEATARAFAPVTLWQAKERQSASPPASAAKRLHHASEGLLGCARQGGARRAEGRKVAHRSPLNFESGLARPWRQASSTPYRDTRAAPGHSFPGSSRRHIHRVSRMASRRAL